MEQVDVHQRLNELAGEALRLEAMGNLVGAVGVWRQVLGLLPAGSEPHRQIEQRMGALAGGFGSWNAEGGQDQFAMGTGSVLEYGGERPKDDPLGVAVAKTVGSMLLSAVVYYFFLFHNWTIAAGFVVLMLVHELGHVIAMKWMGLSASPPIFVPFLGALINMRDLPRNALVESIVGIGGPLLGTIGALVCYAMAVHTHNPMLQFELIVVAQLGFMLNLFNLLPVPPLDGGRITAAISPWLWIPGLVGLALLMLIQVMGGGVMGLVILAMVLFYALPRIGQTLAMKGRNHPYYRVSKAASWGMGVLYFGLGAVLVWMFWMKLGGFRMFNG